MDTVYLNCMSGQWKAEQEVSKSDEKEYDHNLFNGIVF
jgi:hypothetical protein